MTFKTDVDTIITTITGNEDNTTLLTSLSTYMYDDKLDDIINNEQYSKDIVKLQFDYPQINEMLIRLKELPTKYHKKCILLSYIFLKMRGIDPLVPTPPPVPVPLPPVPLPPTPPPVPPPGPPPTPPPTPPPVPPPGPTPPKTETCTLDPKEDELESAFVNVLKAFAEFIVATENESIINHYNTEVILPFILTAKSTPITFKVAEPNLTDALSKLKALIDKYILIESLKEPVGICSNLYDQINIEKQKIMAFKNGDITALDNAPVGFIPIKTSLKCDTAREKDTSDLLIIAGLLMLLDDADFKPS